VAEQPSPSLPEVHGTEPLRGWRWVRLAREDETVVAASIVDHGRPDERGVPPAPVTFGPDAVATCRRTDHEAPTPGCKCGFWSVRERVALEEAVGPRMGGWGLACVELSGVVIETERGHRAAHQRILSVTVADRCERVDCPERTTGLAVDAQGFLRAACDEHGAELSLIDATGLLRTEVVAGTLPPPAGERPSVNDAPGGFGLTFLAALAGATSVVAVAVHTLSSSTTMLGAALLAVVIGSLTGLGAALRTRSRARRDARGSALDVLSTLVSLTCVAVAIAAVLTTTAAAGSP
jgi:hypothetical protein